MNAALDCGKTADTPHGSMQMTAGNSAKLYTPEVLALAVDLASFPLHDTFDHIAEMRSKICGSTITMGLNCSVSGYVSEVGLSVSACAIGQASAAIFARSAMGLSAKDLTAYLADIESWLDDRSDLPDIVSFDLLLPAKAYSARHGALLLPWRAAQRALSNSPDAS